MAKISDLLKKRQALEAQRPEAQIAAIDAEIAREQAMEAAEAEAAKQRAISAAQAEVDAAMGSVRGAVGRLHDALLVLAEAEAKVRTLGGWPVAPVHPDLRRAVRTQLRAWADAEERARRAAVPPEEQRRRFLESQLEHAIECAKIADKTGRSELMESTKREVNRLRAELGVKAPIGERLGRVFERQPTMAETIDAGLLAHAQAWREVADRYRAKERAKAADNAPAQA